MLKEKFDSRGILYLDVRIRPFLKIWIRTPSAVHLIFVIIMTLKTLLVEKSIFIYYHIHVYHVYQLKTEQVESHDLVS